MVSLKQAQIIGLMLIAIVTLSSACTQRSVHQVGSHKVTVARHGWEKPIAIEKRGGVDTLEYRGVSPTGAKTTIVISGDKVKVNGVEAGMLRPGDAVTIGDHGVSVNSLDYGESEKYLRANGSGDSSTETSALR